MLLFSQGPADLLPHCSATESTVPSSSRVLLLGDSFAHHLLLGMRAVVPPGVEVRGLFLGSCPPLPAAPVISPLHCGEMRELDREFVLRYRPGVIVLSARWSSHESYATVEQTVRELQALGVPRIVLIGSFAEFDESVINTLVRELERGPMPTRLPARQLVALRMVDSTLRAVAARTGATFVSPVETQCDRETCLVALASDPAQLLIWDIGHLTALGSRWVAERALLPILAR